MHVYAKMKNLQPSERLGVSASWGTIESLLKPLKTSRQYCTKGFL